MIRLKNTLTQLFLGSGFCWFKICYNKKLLFQLIAFKIHLIISLFQLVAMNIYRKPSLRRAPWNQLKSGNIETLCLLSTLERTGVDRLLLWSKHEYQHSADIFVENIFNLFHGPGFLL